MNPAAGIPICETAEDTPSGQFRWQDIVGLRWQVPISLQDSNGSFVMNQNTWGLCSTLSDTAGRPIMTVHPTDAVPFRIAGSPVVINNLMPDVAPGSLPVAYGNWNLAYMIVNRRGLTVQNDPFSAGWCNLFRFDCRIGGAPVCPNAARLLRIR